MGELITSPEKFTAWFNKAVPGAYRGITADDVKLMTECGLIHRYGYYGHQDLETVRGILRYEELREKRTQKQEQEATAEPPRCKSCGEPLPVQTEGKVGRPKEYCAKCDPLRGRLRYRRYRRRKEMARIA